ncbi:ATP-dependent DNA helicase RecG [Candidatus Spongiisocius sp.]|uniref:ATP-dependent DNA helicase RecG n=1 Tax=Candidatus Spongiisocius sp. TaxID=3101273 RepID=UPI003B5ACAE2
MPDQPAPDSPARSLAYLHGVDVGRVKWIRGKRAAALRSAGIRSVADLLLYAPRRHIDRSRRLAIDELKVGQEATVIGKVERVAVRRPRPRMSIVEATVTDGQGSVKAVWFNQQYQARRLERGIEVALSGRIDRYRGRLQINSPALDVLDSGPDNLAVGRVVPVYRAIASIGTGVLRLAVHNALLRSRPVLDPLPAAVIERHDLVPREEAINSIHFPESLAEVGAARRRLVFDEFFRHEVALAMTRKRKESESVGIAHLIHPEPDLVERFIDGLPFRPTGAQRRVIDEIGADMAAPAPMHRLLHGEVGSGKTVVAVAALLVGVQSGFQAAIMAPTEVLAEQHYEGVTRLLSEARMAPRVAGPRSLFDPAHDDPDRPRIKVALLTGSRADANTADRAGRSRLLADIAGGGIDIVIGTHALIQEGVRFARLGAAVVDEQHRFGVHQRVKLKEKAEGADPDLLIMTATPIPRTLSMTLYGALDVSALDEMPAGRKRIRTWAVSTEGDEPAKAHQAIREEVEKGRQAFVVCPLVEDSDRVEAASAIAEYRRLRSVFPDLRLGLLHGQMRSEEKRNVMDGFRSGDLDVLVATTVIEVGVDVPNATIMVIRDADRFGLSQLHQLRGRVGRGAQPAQCVLLADPTTKEGAARISAMVAMSDGYRLAEEDLRIRGHGTVFGARQSGFSDLRIADILADVAELSAARQEAFALVDGDPGLDQHPDIREEVRVLLGDEVEWLFKS